MLISSTDEVQDLKLFNFFTPMPIHFQLNLNTKTEPSVTLTHSHCCYILHCSRSSSSSVMSRKWRIWWLRWSMIQRKLLLVRSSSQSIVHNYNNYPYLNTPSFLTHPPTPCLWISDYSFLPHAPTPCLWIYRFKEMEDLVVEMQYDSKNAPLDV